MLEITGTASTEHASKYLQQLCKHFAHKVPATYDAEEGTVRFVFGPCKMRAEGALLTIRCQVNEEAQIEQAKHVIDDHLARFAWKEEGFALDWSEPVPHCS